jgi:hypothetical protein
MIRKALLTGNRHPLHFIIPSIGSSVVNVMIIKSDILLSCGVNSDERKKTVAGATGQDIKCQMKWLGLSTKMLGILKYKWGITFQYPENYTVRQLFGSGGAGHHNFYCILNDKYPICAFQLQVISMNTVVNVWRWAR